MLINSSIQVHPRSVLLRVAGVDYPLAANGRYMLPRDEQDAAMRRFAQLVFEQTTADESLVVRSHPSDFFPMATAHGAMLTLSSHKHGAGFACSVGR